jgi:Ca2+-binding EF-hand superfamily protein
MKRVMQTVIAAITALLATAPVFAQAPTQPPDGRVARQQRLTPEQRRAMRQGSAERQTTRGRRGFKRLDADGSGTISRQEWNRRPEAFDRLDANKDGQLTTDELRSGRRKARRS